MEGLGWVINNGDGVAFWLDKWSPMPEPLARYIPCDRVCQSMHARVSDLVTSTGKWDTRRLVKWLPLQVVNRIISVRPPHRSRGADK